MNTAIALPRHKLSVTHYHRMIQAGILGRDDHVELIEGDLIEMAPTGPEHADLVAYLGQCLRTQSAFLVREEKPVTLPDHSEPEPDLALVKPRRYADSHPHPADVVLIIEVADTSLEKDQQVKLPLYARFGIPEVWIVDVRQRTVDIFWETQTTASGARYAQSKRVEQGVLESETLSGIQVAMDQLWLRR
jgi:Uma2 family endonuclease